MVTKRTSKPPARRKPATPATKLRNVWRELSAIGASIPVAKRRALPRDGARNLDHYLDGAPKDN